jgi:uncharacterized protein (TIGR03118 family)
MKRIGLLVPFFVAVCSLQAANTYLVHNLVSDLPGIADHQDKNLVNPWGNGFSGSSPFWVGNNGTGTSTLYDGTGTAVSLIVTIPGPGGTAGKGKVTGVISNGTTVFNVGGANGKPASFLFCGEDGIISGWNPAVDATNAKVMVDNSGSGAVYKGCAMGGTSTAPMLYAANFNSGKIDVWDGGLNAVMNANAFVNPAAPSGFAPFNIQNVGGTLYVMYAKQDSGKMGDVRGVGNGYVTTFDMAGNLMSSLISQGSLNSPWGVAIAPASFGDFANMLLIGNFGDGTIHAFDPATGTLKGTLNDVKGATIAIQGLWSLNFGNGGRGGDTATLYFTAGIGGNGDPVESHGLFGSIQAAPSIRTGVGGGSFNTVIGPNMWVSIFGGGLAATTRAWTSADFKGNQMPTQLDGVGVTVNGQAAVVSFISPAQINFLTAPDLPLGPVNIQTTNNGLASAVVPVAQPAQPAVPTLFNFGTAASDSHLFVAAEHGDGSLAGPAGLIKGATTTPFRVGETAVLFGTAFGTTMTMPPDGLLMTQPFPLVANPAVTIGGVQATVTFAGLVGPGLYQINVVIPAGIRLTDPGAFSEVPVVAMVSGITIQANGLIAVANPAGQ